MGMYYLIIRDGEAASQIPSILEQHGYRVVPKGGNASARSFTLYGKSALWDGQRPPGSRRSRMQSLTFGIVLRPLSSERLRSGPRFRIGIGGRGDEVVQVLKDAGVFGEEMTAGSPANAVDRAGG
jgi:hypothetical protein